MGIRGSRNFPEDNRSIVVGQMEKGWREEVGLVTGCQARSQLTSKWTLQMTTTIRQPNCSVQQQYPVGSGRVGTRQDRDPGPGTITVAENSLSRRMPPRKRRQNDVAEPKKEQESLNTFSSGMNAKFHRCNLFNSLLYGRKMTILRCFHSKITL